MPKRTDINSILIIGSGPIVIGQACEFDYSGSQACKVLRQEGYRVILANSNPATIMTDPNFADATYVEPLTAEFIELIIEKEKPDVLLPTLGGQTALNLAMELEQTGILKKHGVEMIGAKAEAINVAEDRADFKVAMEEIGLDTPRSATAHTMEEAKKIIKDIGLPAIVRPAYILGGKGTGIAKTDEEFIEIARRGLLASPISEILIEESIAGWKEFELEVMRDHKDNCVVICGIENLDPMGVHTGDSITVAPIQTLTDPEYQEMRDASFKVMRRVGVETGGSNVQFAVNPEDGRQVVIEMNPRVSRSSALASKATGFPIAKIAALLAIGYSLDEITNDITKETPASFEPTIDYVVTKIPRWTFEKFEGSPGILGTQMQSVGEVMAIGRTFTESLQKGLRSLEQGRAGLNCDPLEKDFEETSDEQLLKDMSIVTSDRIYEVGEALRRGISIEKVNKASGIDPWFLHQMQRINDFRESIANEDHEKLTELQWRAIKQNGFSDEQLGWLWSVDPKKVRESRLKAGTLTTYKTVDTCAAEFEAFTPYYYSTFESENEAPYTEEKKVIILGSGPNRIGQGIEFDYCCVHASYAASEAGFTSIMVNCNPETVSTDYDTSDRLYFEPLTNEDVANIIDQEQPDGVIVSLGGQTPLKLAAGIDPKLILGTSVDSIELAEDRELWNAFCKKHKIQQPAGGTATSVDQAVKIAEEAGYPVLVRPSFVLGGRAMEVVHSEKGLRKVVEDLMSKGLKKEGAAAQDRPVLIDRFIENGTEIDLDLIRDRDGDVHIGGVMQHVEEAGVHSGDSACITPPPDVTESVMEELERVAKKIANELEVVGLLNIQFVVQGEDVYVIEANPRASRTVPFLAKATGVPLAKIATRVMLGESLKELDEAGLLKKFSTIKTAVKEAVMPFNRFPEADAVLGPEMRSTGEVMGLDVDPDIAYMKSQLAALTDLPEKGMVFISVADKDKSTALKAARKFKEMGYQIAATVGCQQYFEVNGLMVDVCVTKISQQKGIDAAELIKSGDITLVVNSPTTRQTQSDGRLIRQAAGMLGIPCYTTAAGGLAAAKALEKTRRDSSFEVTSLQSLR